MEGADYKRDTVTIERLGLDTQLRRHPFGNRSRFLCCSAGDGFVFLGSGIPAKVYDLIDRGTKGDVLKFIVPHISESICGPPAGRQSIQVRSRYPTSE